MFSKNRIINKYMKQHEQDDGMEAARHSSTYFRDSFTDELTGNEKKRLKELVNDKSMKAFQRAYIEVRKRRKGYILEELKEGLAKYYFNKYLREPWWWVGVGICIVIVAVITNAYMTRTGIFYGSYKVDDPLFSIDFPSMPEKHTFTYGTADAPIVTTRYFQETRNDDTPSETSFMLETKSLEGSPDEDGLNKFFANSIESNLAQLNSSDKSVTDNPEVIISKSSGEYTNYPYIQAKLKVKNIDVFETERFVLVGHTIYWLKATELNSQPLFFDRYANSLKFKLPNNISH